MNISGTCRKALLCRNTLAYPNSLVSRINRFPTARFYKGEKPIKKHINHFGKKREGEEAPYPFHEKVGNFWYPTRTPEEVAKTIDTTLTPGQKAYVDKLKRMLKGPKAKPSIYRDIPKPEDLKPTGNFMPNLAENAEELIDWALSHVPQKMGTRGTRRRKRMAMKWARTRLSHATRKQNTMKAKERKEGRLKRLRVEVREMKKTAKVANVELETRRQKQLEELFEKHKSQIQAVMKVAVMKKA